MPDRAGHLQDAYHLNGPEDARHLYRDWARDYDEELRANGYATPARAAEALAGFVEDRTAPVLDIACGTGLSGEALKAAGFTTVDGLDFTPEMLEVARAKGVYRKLIEGDAADPPVEPGAYANAVAVGALSPGHAPPETLDAALALLPSGGHLAVSLNDHALKEGGYEGRLCDLIDSGAAMLLFKEQGPHLPGIDLEAVIYVLRKN